jgi:preprotein translocase subunit YajC
MDNQTLLQIAPFAFIFAIMYFLLFRPQQQRMKQLREMVEGVRRGDTVVTAGGIVGRVAKVPAKDDPEIVVEIADNVQVRVVRSTLTEVRAKGQPADAKDKSDKTDKN